jgi:hypothetical protein
MLGGVQHIKTADFNQTLIIITLFLSRCTSCLVSVSALAKTGTMLTL